jgi:SAM-dependent methyltransferase
MDEYFEVNRAHWNELVERNTHGCHLYDLDSFRRGESSLGGIELRELGDVAGRSLLHLQCHFGMDTLSWARQGAEVVGLDFSETAIAYASRLRDELGIAAEFICANVYDAPQLLRRQFDIVFTSYGVLCWLPDLAGWGQVIAQCLRPGGTFYIVEGHPFVNTLADNADATGLRIVSPYFRAPEPVFYDGPGYYGDRDAQLEHAATYEWEHSLGDILNALLQAGLRIEFLHEHPYAAWPRLTGMQRHPDNYWYLPGGETSVPFLFSLKATNPISSGRGGPLVRLRAAKPDSAPSLTSALHPERQASAECRL